MAERSWGLNDLKRAEKKSATEEEGEAKEELEQSCEPTEGVQKHHRSGKGSAVFQIKNFNNILYMSEI